MQDNESVSSIINDIILLIDKWKYSKKLRKNAYSMKIYQQKASYFCRRVRKDLVQKLIQLEECSYDVLIWNETHSPKLHKITSYLYGTNLWKESLDLIQSLNDIEYRKWHVANFSKFLSWFYQNGQSRDAHFFLQLTSSVLYYGRDFSIKELQKIDDICHRLNINLYDEVITAFENFNVFSNSISILNINININIDNINTSYAAIAV